MKSASAGGNLRWMGACARPRAWPASATSVLQTMASCPLALVSGGASSSYTWVNDRQWNIPPCLRPHTESMPSGVACTSWAQFAEMSQVQIVMQCLGGLQIIAAEVLPVGKVNFQVQKARAELKYSCKDRVVRG